MSVICQEQVKLGAWNGSRAMIKLQLEETPVGRVKCFKNRQDLVNFPSFFQDILDTLI